MSAYRAASRKFPPGTEVSIRPSALHQSERDLLALEHAQPSSVVVRVIAFRDSQDDPLVLVSSTTDTGSVETWWHEPKNLILV